MAKYTDPVAKRLVTLTSNGPSLKPQCFSSRATIQLKDFSKGSHVNTAKPKHSQFLPISSAAPPISCSKTRRLLTKICFSVSNYWRGWFSLRPNWNLSGLDHAPASHQGQENPCISKCPLDGMTTLPGSQTLDWRSVPLLILHNNAMSVRFCPSPEPVTNWKAHLLTLRFD